MKDVITITREEYKKAFARVMGGKFVKEVTTMDPTFMLMFVPIGVEIEKSLFGDAMYGEDEKTKELDNE